MKKTITLYRGQKSKYNHKPFVPSLLRNDNIQKLESLIKCKTTTSDLTPYKEALSGYTVSTPSRQLLHSTIAHKDHLYYFFLSLVNIAIQVRNNSIFADGSTSFFKQFIIFNERKGALELLPPDMVKSHIATCLAMDSVFDGYYLNGYSIFQHLNFIFPGKFPTLLFDWTSDINIAAFFSKDEMGNLGTIVSMEYPNSLFSHHCPFSGTTDVLSHQSTFYNASGYACDNYMCECKTQTVNMSNGKSLIFQVPSHYLRFNQSLITLQQATCLYWPYNRNMDWFEREHKDTLGFKIFKPEELREKLTRRNP